MIKIYLSGDKKRPIFLMHATLMIPNVTVHPTLDEIQEVLVAAGKHITGLSKGVAQWSGGKPTRVIDMDIFFLDSLLGILR